MRLGEVTPKRRVRVVEISDPVWRMHALRLGISSGNTVEVNRVFTAGPVIVRVGSASVAIGRPLADLIEVTDAN